MNILGSTYIFYADVYFIQNFIIKITILYLSLYCNKFQFFLTSPKLIGKICLASAIGTGIEIIGLFVGKSYYLFLVLVHVLELPLMMCLVLGKERRQMIKLIVTGYFFLILINGVIEILWNWLGKYGNLIFFICVAFVIVLVGVHIWKQYKKMQKGIFQVEIIHNGKQITNLAFYDSGNHLKDPYTGKGVHIISEKLMTELSLFGEKIVCIPYHSLGNANGLMDVVYLDEILIYGNKEIVKLQKIPVGITKEDLFQNKSYEMILNEEVF